jgi:hypothetical protein
MTEPTETPGEDRPPRPDDYEDRHFHDEEEIVPADDIHPRGSRPPARRHPPRRPPPPRRPRFDDD